MRSPNYEERSCSPDMLILHTTQMASAEEAMERLCDPRAKVSAHYLIHRDGRVCPLVSCTHAAWHAGESFWKGRCRLNDVSIGIEIDNPDGDHRSCTPPQLNSLVDLCKDLMVRFSIPLDHVVGHSDVAPHRKKDPGCAFDWQHLSSEGIGLSPRADVACEAHTTLQCLACIGYETRSIDPVFLIKAFQRHHRPQCVDGHLDQETETLIRRHCATVCACRS